MRAGIGGLPPSGGLPRDEPGDGRSRLHGCGRPRRSCGLDSDRGDLSEGFRKPEMNQSQHPTWQQGIKIGTRSIAVSGYAALAVFIGGFGTWAVTAPLTGAVTTPASRAMSAAMVVRPS